MFSQERFQEWLLSSKKSARLYFFLYAYPRGMVKYRKEFFSEHSLVRNTTTKTSVLFFTAHKCASTFFGNFLKVVGENSALSSINYDAYFATRQVPVASAFQDADFLEKGFKRHGFIYGPMRSFRAIPAYDEYRKILLLRDPRDILVSYFYSMAYSHGLISSGMIANRHEARNVDIDGYARKKAASFAQVFEGYRPLLESSSDVLYIRYEDLIRDPQLHIRRMLRYMDVGGVDELANSLAKQLEPEKTPDVMRHKRSGASRQFERELGEETIAALNSELAAILDDFGFEI